MMTEELKKLAECPVCLGRLAPAGKQCTNGHAICKKCEEKVNACPTCRSCFSNVDKNTLLNQLLEFIPVPCKFKEFGCTTENFIGKMEEHEKDCYFKEEKCYGCNKILSYHKLGNHYKTDHLNSLIKTSSRKLGSTSALSVNCNTRIMMKLFNYAYNIRYIKEENAIFLQRFSQNWDSKTIIFALQYIGKKEEATKYFYEIKIDQRFPTDGERFFICTGICIPYYYNDLDWVGNEKAIKLDLRQIFLKNDIPEEFEFGISVHKI